MAFYPYTDLSALITTWQSYGVFSVLIPFVLVFAVVYAILNRSKVLGAKPAIDTIVALAVSLLSLQWDFMPRFFAELFPRTAMGVAVLLVLLILVGLFAQFEGSNAWNVLFAVAGFIIFIVVMLQTYGGFNWFSGNTWWYAHGIEVISGVIVVIIFAAIILGGKSHKEGAS